MHFGTLFVTLLEKGHNMTIQYVIIGVVVAAAIAYAAWRIKKAMSVKSGDPCYGCALKDACVKYKTHALCDKKK